MILKWINIIIIKWIMGECHHLCCMCKYRNQCEEDFITDIPATIRQYKEIRKRTRE